ncbi:nucleoside 2-deoxyribosyltransferase [Staphylococcus carnosus]|uniref:nucleoside 2-deoxyribosyltransferase n=1 Tax=Staphylococcus carnosus TaxID=1281 RepID=UPI0009E34C48|nr:nucleoside 2-deoxyribosyltransferase [Staphylococcus carnosus]QQS85532.1 nucleoside 2-deoxyribosyltransferase [Staphylococcus carnosus]
MAKQIYLGGGMLGLGDQMLREWERDDLKRLGFDVYVPQDDKSINDKTNADQQGLAERIVANDTAGIESADIIVADYLTHAQGSICELGYIQKLKRDKPELEVYVHCTDVRQGTGHIPTEQDRAEFSINQYVYGVILEVTEGRGIQDFEEIRQELDTSRALNEYKARKLREQKNADKDKLRELLRAQQDRLNSVYETSAKAQYEAELWQKRFEAAEQYIKDRLEITPASIPYDNVRIMLKSIKTQDLHELD